MLAAIAASIGLIAGCANGSFGPIQLGAPASNCTPSQAALLTPPAGQPSRGPFSYTVLEQPETEVDVIIADGQESRFQAGTLIISFEAQDVEMELPEGKLPGIQAHHHLIEPVLRDFGLEVVEQSRIPLNLQPIQVGPGATPPPPIRNWKVRPEFLVRVLNPSSVSLSDLQTDATILGLTGQWTFTQRRSAAVFARWFQILRRKDCYTIKHVGPNGLMSPG